MCHRNLVATVTLTLLGSACAGPAFVPRPAPQLSAAITERGERIYRGRVYALDPSATEPTYVYERRVDAHGRTLVSTHVTRDPRGVIQLAESAEHAPDYALARYTLHANQLGQTGSITVDGDEVAFRVRAGNDERTATERVDAPVVVGPTLVGYIFAHLDRLARGERFQVRMAILDRLETIGFDLRAVLAPDGLTRIEMSPSSFLIGLAVDPIYFTYDRAEGSLVRLEGRVPTKIRDGEHWADFDARVDYDMFAARYR
jgi:hypothetical protein